MKRYTKRKGIEKRVSREKKERSERARLRHYTVKSKEKMKKREVAEEEEERTEKQAYARISKRNFLHQNRPHRPDWRFIMLCEVKIPNAKPTAKKERDFCVISGGRERERIKVYKYT